MKVVFLQNVAGRGNAGETKDVPDGYARNFLIPRKLAASAKADALNTMAAKIASKAVREARTEAELNEIAQLLDGKEVVLEAKTGGKDRLYGSVTAADIAVELEKVAGFTVDKRKVEIEDSIRHTGTYEIGIRLTAEIVPKVKVIVKGKSA